MPLAKKTKVSKNNQGNQQAAGSPGNVKHVPESGATDKQGPKPPVSSKHGRNVSIGR